MADSEDGRKSTGAREPQDHAPLLEAGSTDGSPKAANNAFTIVAVLIAAFGPLHFGYSVRRQLLIVSFDPFPLEFLIILSSAKPTRKRRAYSVSEGCTISD
jgi:hypothetical protein